MVDDCPEECWPRLSFGRHIHTHACVPPPHRVHLHTHELMCIHRRISAHIDNPLFQWSEIWRGSFHSGLFFFFFGPQQTCHQGVGVEQTTVHYFVLFLALGSGEN